MESLSLDHSLNSSTSCQKWME